MKKIVGTIAAIALATSAVFADVNVGMGFSRAIFTPIAYDGSDARMDISTSWGAAPRIGGSISGASDECGVVGDFKFDGGSLTVNDNAYVWVKPISWLKINIGQSFDDTLRGNACFGAWDWLRFGGAKVTKVILPGTPATSGSGNYVLNPNTGAIEQENPGTPAVPAVTVTEESGSILTGEDFIFTRICMNPLDGAWAPLVGAIIMADPIEGLHIGVGLPIEGYNNQKMEDVFTKMQVQAGYTIDGVGQIKAQWIGAGKDAEDKVQGQIEAAFCLKAVENMTLDIGVKFRTVEHSPIDVNAYWSMPFDALRVHASVGLSITPKYDTKVLGFTVEVPTQTNLVAGAGIDYDLGNGVGVSADIRFAQTFIKDVDADPAFGFGVYLNKGIANGTLGIGAEGAIRQSIRDFAPASSIEDFVFALPIRVQCFF